MTAWVTRARLNALKALAALGVSAHGGEGADDVLPTEVAAQDETAPAGRSR